MRVRSAALPALIVLLSGVALAGGVTAQGRRPRRRPPRPRTEQPVEPPPEEAEPPAEESDDEADADDAPPEEAPSAEAPRAATRARTRRGRPARPPARRPAPSQGSDHPSFTSDIPCSACHTPEGWSMPGGTSGQAGGFDHARTGFPLSGRHLAAGCTDCHAARRQVRRDCVSCHQDTHQGRLGQDCTRCHTSNGWTDTNPLEAHRLTRFPLSGMHAIAACTDCHRRTGDRSFSAVPSTCISCHEADYHRPDVHPVHDGSGGNAPFSPLCETCHRASGWSPAIADPGTLGSGAMGLTEAAPPRHEMRFPIRVGPHQGAPCTSCHESLEVPAAVRCVGCHAHSPGQLRIDHRTVRVGPDGRGCLGCHPGGMAR